MHISTHLMRLHTRLDHINRFIGRFFSWLTLAMVIMVTGVVLVRLLIDKGSLAVQESVTYAHAILFMLCLGFNLQQDGHVRVDVFYHRFSAQARAWVNALGALILLLPFAAFLFFISIDFVDRAWAIGETSADPGGLPFVYALKTLLPTAALLLALQAVSQVLASLATIVGDGENDTKDNHNNKEPSE